MTQKSTSRVIFIPLMIMILDLIFKCLVVKNFYLGEHSNALGELIIIRRTETHQMALGIEWGLNWGNWLNIVKLCFQIPFVVFFLKVLKPELSKGFKLSAALIVFGWAGNYIDGLFFTAETNSYQHLNYIYLSFLDFGVLNLSSIMVIFGWVMLLILIAIRFSEFKSLFRRKRQEFTTSSKEPSNILDVNL